LRILDHRSFHVERSNPTNWMREHFFTAISGRAQMRLSDPTDDKENG
jgi:hypothetical protein